MASSVVGGAEGTQSRRSSSRHGSSSSAGTMAAGAGKLRGARSNTQRRKGSLLKYPHADNVSRLAQVLLTRLSYANLKVNQGWIKQNIDQVEHLYSSRFRGQAEHRRSSRSGYSSSSYGRTINNKSKPSSTLSPLREDYGSGTAVQSLLMGVPVDTANMAPPRRPFADDQEDHHNLATDGVTRAPHYSGYSPGLYSGYEQAVPAYSGGAVPYLSSQHAVYPYNHENIAFPEQSTLKTSATPPLSQNAHNMYSYIVSPVPGFTAQFAGPASSAANSIPSWLPSGTNPQYSTMGSNVSASHSSHQPSLSMSSTSAGQASFDSSPGQLYGGRTLQEYALVPAPAITPRPDTSAATFSSVVAHATSAPARQGRHMRNVSVAQGHQRNPSLRGDYSMSTVTMDDLDSHFGQ